jgi:hypothetical protein
MGGGEHFRGPRHGALSARHHSNLIESALGNGTPRNMCTQTLVIFAKCPCRKTQISTCPAMEREQYRAWRYFEPIPDHRGCRCLETLEGFNTGCCGMAPRNTCPYVGRRTFNGPQQVEDQLGIHPGKALNAIRSTH